MDLKNYLSPLPADARDEFAKRCETTKGHLQNVMYGLKTCATDLAVLIERESGFLVRRWDLRADWFRHWPELVGVDGAPPIPGAESDRKAFPNLETEGPAEPAHAAPNSVAGA